MILRLVLENFRSVYRTAIAFSPSRLDVLVGANGSGKTNVVRALGFISDIASGDVALAVARQGGQRSLVPKAIDFRKLRGTETRIKYDLDLERPPQYSKRLPNPIGSHDLRFRILPRNHVRIGRESIEFTEPLAVAAALKAADGRREREERVRPGSSRVQFLRGDDHQVQLRAIPKFTPNNMPNYLEWFGLRFVGEAGGSVESPADLMEMLGEILGQREERRTLAADQSILDFGKVLFALTPQVHVFRTTAANVRRFDFQVSDLRSDQQPISRRTLGEEGQNLPSVVRWLRRDPEQRTAWERILRTLRDIAPYVYDVQDNLLQSGREYIEFLETKSGRPVEAWDSADGALRALAMLIALETHESTETLILEEPEKGLHPWAIRTLLDHVRDAIERRRIQVIITTHSPQVLEAVNPEEVLVVTRSHEEGTEVQRASDLLDLKGLRPGELGRLWVKGVIGGFPHDRTHG